MDDLPETFKMTDVPEESLTHKVVQALSKRVPKSIRDEIWEIKEEFLRNTADFRLSQRYGYDNQRDDHLTRELTKHKRYNKKTYHKRDSNCYGRYKCKCDRCVDNKLHHHLKAGKVFTTDENFDDAYIDVDEGYWCIYDKDLGCHVAEDDDRFVPCEMFPTEADFLSEIGCDHLIKDAWREEWLE